jgi:Zinc-binding dehydrogenase
LQGPRRGLWSAIIRYRIRPVCARARGVRVIATVLGDVGEARRLGAEEVYDTKAVAADERWFAERRISAHNIASNSNPLSSPQGLDEVACMLADGKITVRIGSWFELDRAAQMLKKLRHGGLRGKTVIRL